jgi:hypothetical protein
MGARPILRTNRPCCQRLSAGSLASIGHNRTVLQNGLPYRGVPTKIAGQPVSRQTDRHIAHPPGSARCGERHHNY